MLSKSSDALDATRFADSPDLASILLNHEASTAFFARPDGPALKNVSGIVVVSKSLDLPREK